MALRGIGRERVDYISYNGTSRIVRIYHSSGGKDTCGFHDAFYLCGYEVRPPSFTDMSTNTTECTVEAHRDSHLIA